MKKILISGAGGSLFPYLFDVLEDKYEVHVMDSDYKVSIMYKDKNVHIVPNVNNSNFEVEIIKIIKENKIDFYIPLIDEEILKAIKIGKKLNVKILSPSSDFVKICLNKYELMQVLKDKNISYIKTEFANNFTQTYDAPIFLKPNIGRGSRGIQKITSKEEMSAYFIMEDYSKEEVLVQPFIGGEEFTVSVTVNNLNQIIAIVPKLVFVKQGITKHAKCVNNKIIIDKCKEIVKELKPCGSFNVQLKLYNDEVFIFEINPRFSTTLVLSIESGINEIDLNIANYDIKKVTYIEDFKEIKLIRRWENFFYE